MINWDPKDSTFIFANVFAVVHGLPVVGNLLQMKEKKPYKTFTNWAETHGPIYSIRTGASTVVVLNTADVALEVYIYILHRSGTGTTDIP